MRILITNDDGINAPALPHLIKWASNLGDVVTIAPKYEQSGKSHGIELHRRIEAKLVDLGTGTRVYSVDSTPADCIRFATMGLKESFDLVISGINRGYNLGNDIVYSGTVGAIFEGMSNGIKGVALSTHENSFAHAVESLDEVWNIILTQKLFEQNNLYNINIPEGSHKGFRFTKQGGPYYTDEFVHDGNDMYSLAGVISHRDISDLGVDINAVLNGYISITPLSSERTNMTVLEKLTGH